MPTEKDFGNSSIFFHFKSVLADHSARPREHILLVWKHAPAHRLLTVKLQQIPFIKGQCPSHLSGSIRVEETGQVLPLRVYSKLLRHLSVHTIEYKLARARDTSRQHEHTTEKNTENTKETKRKPKQWNRVPKDAANSDLLAVITLYSENCKKIRHELKTRPSPKKGDKTI
jgi:hypothetical protein